MHECLLCKKDMKWSRKQFGNGCIKNIYDFLNINEKIKLKDRENVLYEKIAEKNNMIGLKQNQKIWLADRYLTYQYLDKLTYGNFDVIKKEISNDIKRINTIKQFKELHTSRQISLKNAYDFYKKERKFKTSIDTLNHEISIDNESFKLFLTSCSYIFNLKKHKNQYEENIYNAMQFAFWQLVIEVGSKYFNFDSAAYFLNHSLEENPDDILINDGNIIQTIIEDTDFKLKIAQIIQTYGSSSNFSLSRGQESITFRNSDLYFAIHSADIVMSANKNNDNTWNLDITLIDPYDYTKLKTLTEYYADTESIPKSMVSSILYNLAYCSMKLGVMKEYDVVVKLKINNYEVE